MDMQSVINNYKSQYLWTEDHEKHVIDILKDVNNLKDRQYYHIKKNFQLVNFAGITSVSKIKDRKIMVTRNNVLSIINDMHAACGHKGEKKTHKKISEHYANIPIMLIKMFIQQCEKCTERSKKIKAQINSAKATQQRTIKQCSNSTDPFKNSMKKAKKDVNTDMETSPSESSNDSNDQTENFKDELMIEDVEIKSDSCIDKINQESCSCETNDKQNIATISKSAESISKYIVCNKCHKNIKNNFATEIIPCNRLIETSIDDIDIKVEPLDQYFDSSMNTEQFQNINTDDFDELGRLVAEKLKIFSLQTALEVKKDILGLLTSAENKENLNKLGS